MKHANTFKIFLALVKMKQTQSNKRSHWELGVPELKAIPKPWPRIKRRDKVKSSSSVWNSARWTSLDILRSKRNNFGEPLGVWWENCNKDIKPPDMVHKKKTMYNGNHYPSETMCTYFNVHISHIESIMMSWCYVILQNICRIKLSSWNLNLQRPPHSSQRHPTGSQSLV